MSHSPRVTTEAISAPLAEFDDLMSEAKVCERYAHLVSERELRKARINSTIAFVTGKKGMILYRPEWIAEYLKHKVTPCRQAQSFGSTADTGSGASLAPSISTPCGGTSGDDEQVAAALTLKFSPKLRTV